MLQTEKKEGIGERIRRTFRLFAQRIAAVTHYFRPVPRRKSFAELHVLTVTADLGFYSGVLSATQSCGWTAEWARSIKRAVEICRSRLVPIVVYDCDLPGVDWRRAFDQLNGASADARILLAAPEIDEDLWRMVLHRHGYDVLARSADPEQLRRELRFAWLSLEEPELHDEGEPAAPVLSRG